MEKTFAKLPWFLPPPSKLRKCCAKKFEKLWNWLQYFFVKDFFFQWSWSTVKNLKRFSSRKKTCNYDQFQLTLPFFTPSNIFLLIGVVTQEEWHQRLVWIIPGQLTDVQATCVYAVEVFMPGVIAHFYPRECKLQMSTKKCNKSSAFQFFCSPHKCRNLMLCLCIYDPDNGARFQSWGQEVWQKTQSRLSQFFFATWIPRLKSILAIY